MFVHQMVFVLLFFLLFVLVREIKNKNMMIIVGFCMIGICANYVAKNVNHGRMPVFMKEVSHADRVFLAQSRVHQIGNEQTRLKFLTDIIVLKNQNAVWSIGDLCIGVSLLLLCVWCVINCVTLRRDILLQQKGSISPSISVLTLGVVWFVVILVYMQQKTIH